MSAPPVLRPARVEDAEAVGRLHVAAWRWAYRGILPDARLEALSEADFAARHRGRIAKPPNPHWRAVVAEADGTIRGFCIFGPTRDAGAPPGTGEVYAIYLDREWVGRGLGRALMARALADLAALGYLRASLWVLADNARAIRFYEAAGFARDEKAPEKVLEGTACREARFTRVLERGRGAVP